MPTFTVLKPEYVDHLRDHLIHTQRHANGLDEAVWGGSEDEDYLLPTIFLPSALWTLQEKRLFFHAVTRHSRFRPDLIASSIRTKSIIEVCVYLDALETGRKSVGSRGDDDGEHLFEPALETSEAVIAFEETQASVLKKVAKTREKEQQKDLGAASKQKRAAYLDLDLSVVNDEPPAKIQRTADSVSMTKLSSVMLTAANLVITANDSPERRVRDEAKRGKTAEAQEEKLRTAGLQVDKFLGDGVDMFRLDRMARLTKIYSAKAVTNKQRPKIYITYTLLQLLRKHLRSFLARTMLHVISIAESHFEARQGTKAFGRTIDDRAVLPQHVEEALSLVGLGWTRMSFLEDLPQRIGLDVLDEGEDGEEVIISYSKDVSATDASSTSTDDKQDLADDSSESSNSLLPSSLRHREPLTLDFAWHPLLFSDRHLTQGYGDAAFSTHEDIGDVEDEKDLLHEPDEDEDAMQMEPQMDEKVDRADEALEKEMNKRLRRMYGLKRRRAVSSAIIIEDSEDEEVDEIDPSGSEEEEGTMTRS